MPDEVWVMMRAYLGHKELLALDRALPDGDSVLFPSTVRHGSIPAEEYRGERLRLSKWQCWKMIQKVGSNLGIPRDRLHPHAFRHLFGLNLSKANIATVTRMRLMAHTKEETSQVYDHLNDEMAREAMEKANPFRGMITPGGELLQLVNNKGTGK
jgi:integrase